MFNLNNITHLIDTHPIGRIFQLGQKKAVWKRVTEIAVGARIAIEKDGKLDWDEIVSIKKVGRERVYDIEVEGTHNFVGNGIVAHNTIITGDVGIGTTSPTTALHVGTGAETHTLSTGDALISSDLELDGILYLDGGTIANSAGTASMVLSSAPTTTANTLSASNWLIENTANLGQAALMVNQTKAGDLFTASASGVPKFTITNAGDVGIGTTAPASKLSVGGVGDAAFAIYGTSTGTGVYGINTSAGGNGVYGIAVADSSYGIYCNSTVNANGCGGNRAWYNASDRNLKENIAPISGALAKVLNLQGVTYNFKSDSAKTPQMGFIAQDVLPYAPEVVAYDKINGYYGMQSSQLTALLVNAMQELNAKVNSLASQIQNAVFPEVKTSLISPIANTDLIVDLQPDDSQVATQLIIKGENDEVVTSFDASGNATISGTLYADKIESTRLSEIEDLLREVETNQLLLTEAANWNINTATTSASLSASVSDLFVTGQAAMTSLFVSDNFTTKNINSLTEPLSIQSLASAPLEIMAGKIIIDTNGNTKFLGNVEIAGNLKINNIIVANNIDPIATESGTLIEGEITTNAVAGTATLPAGLTELIIKNEKLKVNSLIYVTPVSSTQNKVLYVKSKDVGVFTIGFNEAIDTDVEFNWWIIELEENLDVTN